MATDLAEFLGAAIGINLLFGIPMFAAALITGVAVFAILALQGNGFRGLEAFIGGSAGLIALCYVVETVLARPDWGEVALHSGRRAFREATRFCWPSASSARRSCRT
jgi:manganese transport protein